MQSIAILIPCYNESRTIAQCVRDFRAALPHADIYVYDNNSTDRSAALAAEAGAIVRAELAQGKGHVVRRMFGDIEADVYLMVDGDGTYDAGAAAALVAGVSEGGNDMVVARRIAHQMGAYRGGHRFGNWLLTRMMRVIFRHDLQDVLSGYRAFSRRFVKSFPALATGFETEVELTTHALSLRAPVVEIDTTYFARPQGSVSKLNTWRDGFRILFEILNLFRAEKPLAFYSSIALLLAAVSLALGIPVVIEYLTTGRVDRFPTAILAASIMTIACFTVFGGLILDTVSRGRREMKRLFFLREPGPRRR